MTQNSATNETGGRTPDDAPARARTANIVSNFLFGLKVLGGEISWLLIRALRTFELRQLRRRLETEYALLGHWAADALDAGSPSDQKASGPSVPDMGDALPAPDADTDITRKQIRFLRDEIAFLEQERDTSRTAHLQRQRDSLGI
ncbi:MAG: hypothetical protein AB7E47_11625 [Desulfovibrionaceae bacterium]